MTELMRRKRRILLTTVSSDAHTWNLVFLQMALEECGYDVVNLGPCVSDDLLISTALTVRPDVVVVSTVNGHGHIDGARMARALRSVAALRDLPMIIGGKLTTVGGADQDHVSELLRAGYDAVMSAEQGAEALHRYLAANVGSG